MCKLGKKGMEYYPEIFHGLQYTKTSDICTFRIIINEFISSEGISYSNIPHDYTLTIKVCKGLRPNILNMHQNYLQI